MLIEGLYKVEEVTQPAEKQYKFVIFINKDHDIFKGHFPGNPVMPGVCMIQIIKEVIEEQIHKSLSLESSSNIKFMAKINPEKNPVIHLVTDFEIEETHVKLKNITSFDDTVALKLSANFKILQ